MAGLIELTKVKVHPTNVKEHPESQIKNLMQLIQWVGFKDPLVLDKTNTIRAGHGRLIAARRLEMDKVPFVRLEGLTKKQMDLFVYMDNEVNHSPWIKDNVELILEDMPLEDLELFDVDWDDVRKEDYKEETDDIPEPPVTPKTKPGQLYLLGKHKIMCGDSTKDYQKLFQETKPKILFTDPPFNIDYSTIKQDHEKITNDNLNTIDFESLMLKALNDMPLTCYIFCNWKSFPVFTQIMEKIKRPVKACIIWDKQRPAQNLDKYYKVHEFLLYSGKFGGQKTLRGDIWRISREYSKLHPTAKPLELCTMAITDSTTLNDIVYDPFLGSGSTLIACEQTNRTCYGMEIDPAYVDVIIKRWENFTGKKAKLIS